MATAAVLRERRNGGHTDRVVIGKDTRLSCYMLEQALTAGFLSMGMEVILTGPIPTPGIAKLTGSLRADIGVMISASHNNFEDNGIKLFGADGYKLADDIELEIEEKLDGDLSAQLALPGKLGKARRMDDALGRYVESIKRTIPRGESLEGLKVIVDCAHGAAYKVAPMVLWELEADVRAINIDPNGRNINDGCGATDTERLQAAVIEQGVDIGIALDGDADRLIVVDEKGDKVDGDQLMALLALHWKDKGLLANNGLVATVMSNLGLERLMHDNGIALERTMVGDRYVVERMREGGFNVGGEQSGHIVLADHSTTGDGLLAAIQILNILKNTGQKASEALRLFEPVPQILRSVHFQSGQPLDDKDVKDAIARAEESLANDGRVLVRASGTEPVIRVMAEGDNSDLVESVVGDLCAAIEKAAKTA